jgi:transcriptional regulator with XRE-family HTH domain
MDQTELRLERALIGRRLRKARERAGCSIEEAAQLADVQPLAVQTWEKGKRTPCLVQLRMLLGLYGVTAFDVLFDENPYRIGRAEAAELLSVASKCSPAVQSRVELLIAVMGEPNVGRAGELSRF